MKKYRTTIVLLCMMALLAGVFYYIYTAPPQQAAPPGRVSLVLYNRGTEQWTALSLGVRQACSDLGLELTVPTPVDGDDPARQRTAAQRELANGADGLLIAANDSEQLRAWAMEQAAQSPLVLLQSGVGDALPLVAADNAAMGHSLANALAGRETRVVALAANLQRDSVRQRYEAFSQAAQAAGIQVDVFARSLEDLPAQFALYPAGGIPPLVAFDIETLDRAIDLALEQEQPPPLYGFGSSDKSVYYLDRGLVRQVCCDDEYNMGYLAVIQLAQKMGLPTPDLPGEVGFSLVDRENLYDEEIARLLFPVIQ